MNQAHLTSIYNWWTNIDKELLEKVLEAKKLNPIFKRKVLSIQKTINNN
jgi:hypothetical protein